MTDLVSEALQNVSSLPAWPLARWDLLIRQARAANLLSRIAVLIDDAGLIDAIPLEPRAHLLSARVISAAQSAEVLREVDYVRKALESTGSQPIFLKGTAYALADLPAAKGRMFSDLDVLVPKDLLPQVESNLMLNGWATTHHDPYDQRYYRRWMHELPPFQHIHRLTVLDVHHGILPDTARSRPDPGKLRAAAVQSSKEARVSILAPADMILHSMTHLFHNEDLSHGLRDISDMDLLLRHFGEDAGFWDNLLQRAQLLGLTRPLYYGLRYTSALLGTPIPATILEQSEQWGPPRLLRSVLDGLWMRALRPHHASVADILTPLALLLLYMRAHWLRMPPHLLLFHLSVKAFRKKPES